MLTNIAATVNLFDRVNEVQSVTVTGTDGLLFGGYDLDFNQSRISVYFRADESAEDFETKFESLPTTGNVTVSRDTLVNSQSSFIGYKYWITFESIEGDLPLVTSITRPFNGSHIHGSNLTLTIQKEIAGSSIPTLTLFSGLTEGRQYIAEVFASNSIGDGDSTVTVQDSGMGVVPFAVNLVGRSSAPILNSVSSFSANQLIVSYSPPIDNGGAGIDKYIIEYSTNISDSLEVRRVISFRL